MLTRTFRARMQAGKEEEALEDLRTLVKAVQANEPGVLAYICHRFQNDPSEIIFFEIYTDDAAFEAHRQTPHMAVHGASYADLFDAPKTKIEQLERIEGFVRSELT